MPRIDTPPIRGSRLLTFAAVCVTVAALYLAQDVLIPLALAVLVTFLLTPLVQRLENVGMPRVPAVLTVFTAMLAVVAILGWVVYVQLVDLADRLPSYTDDIAVKVRSLVGGEPGPWGRAAEALEDVSRAVNEPATKPATTAPATQPDAAAGAGAAAGTMGGPAPQSLPGPEGAPVTGPGPSLESPLPVTVVEEDPTSLELLGAYVDRLLGPLGTAGLVLVFVIFMLLQREDLRDRLIRLVGFGQLNITTQALDDAASRISRYLLAQAIINGTYGLTIGIGLWAIGWFLAGEIFPNFILWGLLCAILRFIPYIGPWLAAAFPLALAFAVYPGFGMFIAVAAMFVVVELLSNNVMEPWLYGASTGISAVAVIVAAVFWTWLWGPIGLVMATPLTVCLVVIGRYVPQLAFFNVMFGDEPVLSPRERVYQRLLAEDEEEATELVEEYLETQSLEDVFDTVLLPALALAEQDRHARRLDDERARFIRQAMNQIIDEMADREKLQEVRRAADQTEKRARGDEPGHDERHVARSRLPEGCVVNVLILPAHDEADEIVANMLGGLLELRNYCVYTVGTDALASEMIGAVESRGADIVVVSALPPAAVAHSRYLCKRLHGRFPDINTVVGLWTVRGDLKRARERILCSDTVKLSTTLARALELINEYAQPKLLQAQQVQVTNE